jgi:hypothetical protein
VWLCRLAYARPLNFLLFILIFVINYDFAVVVREFAWQIGGNLSVLTLRNLALPTAHQGI